MFVVPIRYSIMDSDPQSFSKRFHLFGWATAIGVAVLMLLLISGRLIGSTGELTFVEVHKDDGQDGSIGRLDGATSVVVSPDNNHLYVAASSDDAVTVFSRNTSTGALTFDITPKAERTLDILVPEAQAIEPTPELVRPRGQALAPEDINMELVGRWPYGLTLAITAVEIDGRPYAFLGSGAAVLVLDISDPNNPTQVGEITTSGTVKDLSVSENILLVADGQEGLRVIDVSDPTRPREVGFIEEPNVTVGVAHMDKFAVVLNTGGALSIVDISDPSSPDRVGSYYSAGVWSNDVAVVGELALVAEGLNGILVLDISNPTKPTAITRFRRLSFR